MATPTLVSVNVGRIRAVPYRGHQVRTGIYKAAVDGPVMVRSLNLDGDEQADLSVHGGVDKAVYLYPAEHYEAWQRELNRELDYGTFGENLTVTGLLEDVVRIGDELAIGRALLQVTEPRVPCFKLGIKMSDQRFLRRFLESGRSGFYCRVLREGAVEAGQSIELAQAGVDAPTIAEVVRQIRGA
ncbi:MAG: MOSC domain-containing protein [Dehalococcoidia bacterium]